MTLPEAIAAARTAGFSGDGLVTIVACGVAESGLATDAHNTSGEDSRGWLQVNVVPAANPQFASSNLFDPVVCARAAFAISSQGTNFHPWSTFTNGAYLQHVDAVRAALGQSTPDRNPPPGRQPSAALLDWLVAASTWARDHPDQAWQEIGVIAKRIVEEGFSA